MLTKAELTKQYIIEKVAPIFNNKGYIATTMADITQATSLTKGAIYGNFQNKDELAIAAFTHNVKSMLRLVNEFQEKGNTPFEKLVLVADFYKQYYSYSIKMGGCPILNMGVSTKSQHPKMFEYVQFTVEKIISNVQKLVEEAQYKGEIKESLDAKQIAKSIYTTFQGAIFMSHTLEDESYLVSASLKVQELLYQIKN